MISLCIRIIFIIFIILIFITVILYQKKKTLSPKGGTISYKNFYLHQHGGICKIDADGGPPKTKILPPNFRLLHLCTYSPQWSTLDPKMKKVMHNHKGFDLTDILMAGEKWSERYNESICVSFGNSIDRNTYQDLLLTSDVDEFEFIKIGDKVVFKDDPVLSGKVVYKIDDENFRVELDPWWKLPETLDITKDQLLPSGRIDMIARTIGIRETTYGIVELPIVDSFLPSELGSDLDQNNDNIDYWENVFHNCKYNMSPGKIKLVDSLISLYRDYTTTSVHLSFGSKDKVLKNISTTLIESCKSMHKFQYISLLDQSRLRTEGQEETIKNVEKNRKMALKRSMFLPHEQLINPYENLPGMQTIKERFPDDYYYGVKAIFLSDIISRLHQEYPDTYITIFIHTCQGVSNLPKKDVIHLIDYVKYTQEDDKEIYLRSLNK